VESIAMFYISKNTLRSYLLVALYGVIIFFQGCTKHENNYQDDTITKVGNIALENGDSILINLYSDNKRIGISDLAAHFSDKRYPDDLTLEEIENEYFISMSFQRELTKSPISVVLEPCEMKIEYDDAFSYPVHSHPIESYEEDLSEKNLNVLFRIKNLIQIGYISEDRDKQKDLCLFRKDLIIHTGGPLRVKHDYTTSNKLVYTAEEINNLMTEYESLTP